METTAIATLPAKLTLRHIRQAWEQNTFWEQPTEILLAIQGKLNKLIDYMVREGHEITDDGTTLGRLCWIGQDIANILFIRGGCDD